ncbi:MAG: DUF1659 domain-containing protein [Dethiobacter sp.]|nr:MAG: DUF1659 domain-containing protein [Dethiobacter sp.]
MAVTANPVGSRLQLRLVVGQDAGGNPVYRSRAYSNVKPQASDQNVFDVGNSLANLQQHDLDEVRRINESVLTEG